MASVRGYVHSKTRSKREKSPPWWKQPGKGRCVNTRLLLSLVAIVFSHVCELLEVLHTLLKSEQAFEQGSAGLEPLGVDERETSHCGLPDWQNPPCGDGACIGATLQPIDWRMRCSCCLACRRLTVRVLIIMGIALPLPSVSK